ncbi:MAG TPA: hypothetical protein PKD86_13700 [Gemmatales bacterium]|nr:hypothetical protein [Gemmatales bacterium]HMP60397.1 hypothetical protein [Gemmatales bacterium]
MGQRGDRFRLRAVKQKEARATNGPRKAAERARREQRLLAELKACQPPYTKVLRSWLSAKLAKPEAKITPEDVKAVLAGAAQR